MICCKEILPGRGLVGLLLMALALCLLQAPLCSTQSIVVHVTRAGESGEIINLLRQPQYYSFEGDGFEFKCICSNSGATMSTRIVSFRWKHNGQVLDESTICIPLTYDLVNASSSDDGDYVCEATHANGTVTTISGGTLEVIDQDRIQAPPFQHGLINTRAVLNCSTTFLETNGISITWHYGDIHLGRIAQIDNVNLSNEGMYMCSVYLGRYDLRIEKKVNFSVIVPPTIIQKPKYNNPLLGNQQVTFPVRFQSRFRADTIIVWHKNDNSAVPGEHIRTIFEEEPFATTELYFSNLRRSDAGQYRVIIENTFPKLSPELSQVEASFNLDVTVYPVAPSEIQFTSIGSTQATVTWSMTNQNEDDLPDNITVLLNYSNGTSAGLYVVDGQATELAIDLLPGLDYTLYMRASNVDGQVETSPLDFKSVPGAPSLPAVSVVRDSSSTVDLTVSLAYTGGGNISHFAVSYKRIRAEDWIPLGSVPAVPTGNTLEWMARVVNDDFTSPGIEFRVLVVNTRGYSSEPSIQPELIELPGPPRQPIHISSTHNSILFQVQLSPNGAPPILSIDIDFLSHPDLNQTINGPFQLGELVQATIGGLDEKTVYRFSIVAVNYGGRGVPSPSIETSTEMLPPVPLYGIVLISAGTAIVLIICVVILVLVGKHIHNIRMAKRQYRFPSGVSSDAVKSLDSGHELVSGTKRPLPSIPIPTSSIPPPMLPEARPTSQSTYSRQGSTSTYPLSPQLTLSTSDGGSSPTEQYQFERRVSYGTSTNDSESESNYPRYTYKVSPSPPNLSTPQLRANSLHSMQSYHSTATRLTSTSSSTRDSLILGSTEFNATNV